MFTKAANAVGALYTASLHSDHIVRAYIFAALYMFHREAVHHEYQTPAEYPALRVLGIVNVGERLVIAQKYK